MVVLNKALIENKILCPKRPHFGQVIRKQGKTEVAHPFCMGTTSQNMVRNLSVGGKTWLKFDGWPQYGVRERTQKSAPPPPKWLRQIEALFFPQITLYVARCQVGGVCMQQRTIIQSRVNPPKCKVRYSSCYRKFTRKSENQYL